MDVKSRMCANKEIRLIVSDSDLQREQSSLKEERQSGPEDVETGVTWSIFVPVMLSYIYTVKICIIPNVASKFSGVSEFQADFSL